MKADKKVRARVEKMGKVKVEMTVPNLAELKAAESDHDMAAMKDYVLVEN